MNILIIGGLGYLGARIAHHLSKIPSLSIQITTRSDASYLKKKFNDNVTIYQVDYSDLNQLNTLIEESDHILFLLSVNEVDASENPLSSIEINILLFYQIISLIKTNPSRQLIFFSTIHVYGAPLSGYYNEKTCCKPGHPYSISHKAAEDYLLYESNRSNLRSLIFRVSNVIGAPFYPNVNRWMLLVNDLCKQAVLSRQLTLQSDGAALRDFISIRSVFNVVEWAIFDRFNMQESVYNLSSGRSLSVLEIAEIVQNIFFALSGNQIPINKKTSVKSGNQGYLFIDNYKIKSVGVNVELEIKPDIEETIKFCMENFKFEG